MVDDLSRYHQPVSELFPQIDDCSRYRLSEEQIEFYQEHGYLAGIKMLDDEQLRALREELAELVDPAHPAFVVPAAQLLGGAVRFWHTRSSTNPRITAA